MFGLLPFSWGDYTWSKHSCSLEVPAIQVGIGIKSKSRSLIVLQGEFNERGRISGTPEACHCMSLLIAATQQNNPVARISFKLLRQSRIGWRWFPVIITGFWVWGQIEMNSHKCLIILIESLQDFYSVPFSTLVVYSIAAEFFAKGPVTFVSRQRREVKQKLTYSFHHFFMASSAQAAVHLVNTHII